MLIWINFFNNFPLLLAFSIITKVESQDSDLVDLILKVKDFYGARSVIIVTNYVDGNIADETAAVDRQRLLSSNQVLSDSIKLENLRDVIDRYHKTTVLPLYVIILRTSTDFEMLVEATRGRRVTFASLVIFGDDEILTRVCAHPEGNYFNLNYDALMLVLCRGEEVPAVREWYSVHLNETEVTDLALWEGGRFERTTNETLHVRRDSLKGISLRVTRIKIETTAKDGYSTGYFGQVLDIISQRGNFVLDLQPTEKIYGIYNPETGKWNGVMEKLANGETDLALGETTITSSRLSIIDFSKPIVTTRAYYYVKKSDIMILPWHMYYIVIKNESF